jgi:hypothetical protein
MGNRFHRKAMVFLAIPMLAGCEATAVQSSGGTTLLTAAEMDNITVGSASAAIDVAARALAPDARTTTSASTLAVSASSPVAGPPFLHYLRPNYSTSQGSASATSSQLAEANGSSHTAVSSANGGAWIDVTGTGTAAGSGTSHAQLSIQFYVFSTGRADLVLGTAIARACCAPFVGAQVTAHSRAGGPYSIELQGHPLSEIPGQAQSRVDIAVASSALPIVDPGQMMGLLTPRGSPNY